jgi:hypothetical protein
LVSSSGSTAEPIHPDAPVTNTRTQTSSLRTFNGNLAD